MLRLEAMTTQTVEANMKMYARVVAESQFSDSDVDAMIRYAMEYQSRMGW
jgi:hypothetical protein